MPKTSSGGVTLPVEEQGSRFCRTSGYDRGFTRKYPNDEEKICTETRKCPHKSTDRCTIPTMKHAYAYSCRAHRHPEGLKGLLTSRGRAMAQILKAQSFSWVATDPQEVPSTA